MHDRSRIPAMSALLCALQGAGPAVAGTEATPCQLAAAAVQQHAQALGMQAAVQCRGQGIYQQAWPDAEALPQPLADRPLASGPLNWPVERHVATGARRILQVPLQVQWTAPVWTLTRALPASQVLGADDLRIETMTWPAGVPLTLARAGQRPAGRLPHAMPAGAPLNLNTLLPADLLARGEAVTAIVGEGAISLQRPARLLDAARPGTDVRIQLQGQAAVLQGRLDAERTVWVGTP